LPIRDIDLRVGSASALSVGRGVNITVSVRSVIKVNDEVDVQPDVLADVLEANEMAVVAGGTLAS
jgi:hypothetical protein